MMIFCEGVQMTGLGIWINNLGITSSVCESDMIL